MNELHEIDQVAYVRFASVYRSFKDIDEFMRELEDLIRLRQQDGTIVHRPREKKGEPAA
jgi:transcriptional regulator NrdR family protein